MTKNNINTSWSLQTVAKGFIMTSLSLLVFSCSSDEKQKVTNFNKLVMADEFDTNGAPNSAMWNYDIGKGPNNDGWGNNELEYYTNRPENVKVVDGMLQITAKREAFMGSEYTSGKILTKGLFEKKYGRFEARIKMPSGQGLWPAFWMLGANSGEVVWPFCGEIDIMEYRGQQPTITNAAMHGPGYSGANAISKGYDLLNDRLDTDFHIFGIEWGKNYVNFYVDDVLFKQITPKNLPTTPFPEDLCIGLSGEECAAKKEKWNKWVFNQPFYIILNLAVGGSYVGSPSNQTAFPQTMYVDYVRIYE